MKRMAILGGSIVIAATAAFFAGMSEANIQELQKILNGFRFESDWFAHRNGQDMHDGVREALNISTNQIEERFKDEMTLKYALLGIAGIAVVGGTAAVLVGRGRSKDSQRML